MPDLIIISDQQNSQSEALRKAAIKSGRKAKCLYSDLTSNKISISPSGIIINRKEVTKDTTILYTQFTHEFSPFPLIGMANDFTIFMDQYAKQEQLKSQFLSMGNVHESNGGRVINNPFRTSAFKTNIFTLDIIKKNGIGTIDYIVTNSIRTFSDSKHAGYDSFYWSYLMPNSPVKYIRKKNLAGLIDGSSVIPFMFFPYEEGLYLRMWFFRNKAIIGMQLIPPVYDGTYTGLEKYNYFMPHENMSELATELHKLLKLDFYEVKALVTKDTGELKIIGINPDPSYYSLDRSLGDYLNYKILDNIGTVSLKQLSKVPKPPVDKKRSTTLLTRMLETQLMIHQQEGRQ